MSASPSSGPAPQVAIAAEDAKGGKLSPGAKLPPSASLRAQVTLVAPARVSLVHVNVGHGLEPLALNVALPAGTTMFAVDGGAVLLPLDGLDGPQKLSAVAANRELTLDEALSAAKGLVPDGVGVAAFDFQAAAR